jgi:hypothetical protein
MAEAPRPVTSPPRVDGQPWDATSEEAVAGWDCLEDVAGSVDFATGKASGDHFANAPGAGQGPWKQT